MGVTTGSISDGRPVMSSAVMSLAKGDRGGRLRQFEGWMGLGQLTLTVLDHVHIYEFK